MGMRKTLKKIYALLEWKQKVIFIMILLIMLLSSALTQVTPKAIGWLTDDIFAEGSMAFIDLLPMLLLILIVNVVNELLKIWRRLLVEDTATKTEKKARTLVIASLMKAPLRYFKENMTGNIHGRLNRCLEGTIKLEKLLFMDLAPAVFNSIAAVIVIFTTLPFTLALPMLLVIPIGVLIVLRQITTQKGIRIALLETKANMDGSLVELLNGIEVIRMANSTMIEEHRFSIKSEELREKEMKHHKQMAKYDAMKFFNEVFFTVFIIGASAYLATQGIISVGAVLTAYLCFSQLIKPLEELHRILDELSESFVLAEDFFKMAEIACDFSYQPVSAKQLLIKKHDMIFAEKLRLAYESNEEVLKGIDLKIKSGSFIGIAGPSGCGKSSLIKAICKLEKSEGALYIDGREIESLSRETLSELIALVPQNPFLIAGTIYENICYGLKVMPSEEEVMQAVAKAGLTEFVESQPQKLHTLIAERGNNLSGGQRQRIALARIFLRKPKVLILDEATSALDNTTERFVQKEIERLKEENDMTIISIAHRLTTLQNCDEILVMYNGMIVQKGIYKELIEKEGIFNDMYHGRLK